MALVAVEVENNSGQTVGLTIEENGEQHEYLKKLVRREDLRGVKVVKPTPVRKPAAK